MSRKPNVPARRLSPAALAEAASGAWRARMRLFAERFAADVGLFWHRWTDADWGEGGELEVHPPNPEAARVYSEQAANNPWIQLIRQSREMREGFIILGMSHRQNAIIERQEQTIEFFTKYMVPFGRDRGMGAVLFRHRLRDSSTLLIGVAVTRPGDPKTGEGEYSAEEVAFFAPYVPLMCAEIRNHPIFTQPDFLPFLEADTPRERKSNIHPVAHSKSPETSSAYSDKDGAFKRPMKNFTENYLREQLEKAGVAEALRGPLAAVIGQLVADAGNDPALCSRLLASLVETRGTLERQAEAAKLRDAVAHLVGELDHATGHGPPRVRAGRAVPPEGGAGRGRPFTLTEEQRENVRRRRGEGEKLSDIAHSLGVSEATVSRVVNRVSRRSGR